MPPTNDFVPFCNENTGTNLPTQSAYLANPDLPLGNQPGIASSSLNNKALRQGTTIAAIVAQYVANATNTNVTDVQNSSDHAIPTALLAQLTSALGYKDPITTKYTTGSGNHNLTQKFAVSAANATVGATYSDGTTTFTVSKTISAANELIATGNAAAAVSGTLTKTGGTGDATIVFYAVRAPLYIRVKAIGGGGGGAGSSTIAANNGGAGSNGASTTFGTTLIVAGGGSGGSGGTGQSGGGGGTASLGSGPDGIAVPGSAGSGSQQAVTTGNNFLGGSAGGSSAIGGAGGGGPGNAAGVAANTNSGSGGGGAGGPATGATGASGGSGGYVEATITHVNSAFAYTFAYAVGALGGHGSAGTSGFVGGDGAAGLLLVQEFFQ